METRGSIKLYSIIPPFPSPLLTPAIYRVSCKKVFSFFFFFFFLIFLLAFFHALLLLLDPLVRTTGNDVSLYVRLAQGRSVQLIEKSTSTDFSFSSLIFVFIYIYYLYVFLFFDLCISSFVNEYEIFDKLSCPICYYFIHLLAD